MSFRAPTVAGGYKAPIGPHRSPARRRRSEFYLRGNAL
jgi:hypothetical protein